MLNSLHVKTLKFYIVFQVIFSAFAVILTSVGAFFHFLLDHEISILESWLHHNNWEIITISKVLTFALIYKWLQIQRYQVQGITTFLRLSFRKIEKKTIIVSFFIFLGYLTLNQFQLRINNVEYWYYHLISFFGSLLFFGLDFLFLSFLQTLEYQSENPGNKSLLFNFLLLFVFSVTYILTIPDYYSMFSHVIFSFSLLLVIFGYEVKSFGNVFVFILLFIAPMSSFFGYDPIWGNEYSYLKKSVDLKLPFLVVIWMISFVYYKYREVIINHTRKFIR